MLTAISQYVSYNNIPEFTLYYFNYLVLSLSYTQLYEVFYFPNTCTVSAVYFSLLVARFATTATFALFKTSIFALINKNHLK